MRRQSALCLSLCACILVHSAAHFADQAHGQAASSNLLAEHQHLRDRVAAAMQSGSLGEWDGALALAERALELAESLYGHDALEIVADLEHLGLLRLAAGDGLSARTSLERSLRILESRLGPTHPATSKALNALGTVLLHAGELEDAASYFEEAIEGLEQSIGASSRAVAQSLYLIGLALRRQGRYQTALVRLERALAILNHLLGERHHDTLTVRGELALVLGHLGEFESSRTHFEATLAISEQAFGIDSSFSRPLLSGLGGLHFDAGNHREARPYFERALVIAERLEPRDDSLVIFHLTDLGLVLVELGERLEAKQVFRRFLALARNSPGGTSAAVTQAILIQSRDPLAARSLIDEAIAESERTYGPRSTVTGSYLAIRASLRHQVGATGRALADAERALDIRRERLGNEDLASAHSLKVLTDLLLELGGFEEARKLLEQALAARVGDTGHEGPEVESLVEKIALSRRNAAHGRNGLATPHLEARFGKLADELRSEIDMLEQDWRFRDALPVAVRLLKLSALEWTGEPEKLASNLGRVGNLHRQLGDHQRALARYREALEALQSTAHKGDGLLAEVLCGEVAVYLARGDSRPLEPSLRRALETIERSPELDPERAKDLKAQALSLLATVHLRSGAVERALAEATEALDAKLDLCIVEDWRCSGERLVRGRILRELGRTAAARSVVEKALFSLQRKLGENHPATASGHYELGMIHLDLGDFAAAREQLRHALKMKEKSKAPRDLLLLDIIDGLFLVSLYRDELREAAHYVARLLDGCEALLAPGHPRRAACLSSYGELMRARGDLKLARTYLEKAVDAFKKGWGLEHASTASAILRLGLVLEEMGKIRQAKRLYQQGHRWLVSALGPGHPDTALSFKNLASFFETQRDARRAIAMATSCLDAEEQLLLASLGMGTDEERLRVLSDLGDSVDLAVSLNTRSFPGERKALRLAVETVLRRKGRGLDSSWEYTRMSRADGSPLSDESRRALTSLRSEMGSILLHGRPDLHARKRATEIRRIEREIRWRSASLEEAARGVLEDTAEIDLRRVQQAVPPRAALIELVVFRAYQREEVKLRRYNRNLDSAEPRYVAYVIHRSGEPRWIDLGKKREIDGRITEFRDALSLRQAGIREQARRLDSLTMARIRPLLGDVTQLIISPDGALNLVPFEALVDTEGQFLVERFSVSYVSSGRDLLRSDDDEAVAVGPSVVVGGADFDTINEWTEADDAARATDVAQLQFAALPGTLEEAIAIGRLLRQARVVTGAEATEAVLSAVDSPPILHIATHGFFLQDRDRSPVPRLGLSRLGRPALGRTTEDPMLRSGLALAGANRHDGARDSTDGVLTAREVMDLDLWGTEVAVLSACETAVGEIQNGEGVFGLRRALVLAGARTQVMSLWQVSDEATKDLMISWYQQILRGVPRAEAMRQAQLAALRGQPLPGSDFVLRGGRRIELSGSGDSPQLGGTRHPFYWASFIVSGESGPLPIETASP